MSLSYVWKRCCYKIKPYPFKCLIHQLVFYQETVVVDNGDGNGSEKESKILLCYETEVKFQPVLTESEHCSAFDLTLHYRFMSRHKVSLMKIQLMNH